MRSIITAASLCRKLYMVLTQLQLCHTHANIRPQVTSSKQVVSLLMLIASCLKLFDIPTARTSELSHDATKEGEEGTSQG